MLEPLQTDYCRFDPHDKAQLIVVVDTEEEFNWSETVSRKNTSVTAIKYITRIQDVFDQFGITPVYVIDHPVVSQPDGYRLLQEIHSDGRCLIGAHLHPWVNPPLSESVNLRNSFPGNLPRELEASKLRVLGDCIGERFGIRPKIYKAGRYGIGPNTAAILQEQGYEVDVSVRAHTNFSNIEGPDFTNSSAWPYWFGGENRMLEIPVTTGFSGIFRHWGVTLHRNSMRPSFKAFRVRGVMRRLNLLKKLDLSPENSSFSEMTKLVKLLNADGLKVFGLAFHSPSLEPGNTPYVASMSELDSFIACCRLFFEWFTEHLGGVPSQPLAIRRHLLESTRSSEPTAQNAASITK